MSATYVHRQDWTHKTSAKELEKEFDRTGLTAHPLAVVDKINQKLLNRGIMPRIQKTQGRNKT